MTTGQFPKSRQPKLGWDPGKPIQAPHPDIGIGTVCVVSAETMRWAHFGMAMTWLGQYSPQFKLCWDPGVNIIGQCNGGVRHARENDSDWLWIIGDDHVFNPDIIHRLFSREKDVIVPLVLQRSAPFSPVVYKSQDAEGHYEVDYDLPETGVQQVIAAGSAGMLVSKRVLAELPEKPFEVHGPYLNEDIEFCRVVREAGFKIWVDVETHMAHIGSMVVWPEWMGDHGWQQMLTIGPSGEGDEMARMPVRRMLKGPALTAA